MSGTVWDMLSQGCVQGHRVELSSWELKVLLGTQDDLGCRDMDTMEENGIPPQGEKSRGPRGEAGGDPTVILRDERKERKPKRWPERQEKSQEREVSQEPRSGPRYPCMLAGWISTR